MSMCGCTTCVGGMEYHVHMTVKLHVCYKHCWLKHQFVRVQSSLVSFLLITPCKFLWYHYLVHHLFLDSTGHCPLQHHFASHISFAGEHCAGKPNCWFSPWDLKIFSYEIISVLLASRSYRFLMIYHRCILLCTLYLIYILFIYI